MSKLQRIIIFIIGLHVVRIGASTGDRSQFYNHCFITCYNKNCENGGNYKSNLSTSLSLWSCEDDCSYECMWKTVEYFISHGLHVPQFHGKWPFVRFMGMQEPASTIFSLMNCYAHWTMFRKFLKVIKPSYPMFYIWSYFSIVCINGWIWSAIFHTRDKVFTEIMDYCCAFTIVLSLLYCMLIRITYKSKRAFAVISCFYFSILYTHLSYLWSGNINYGYNMKFNIITGFFTFAITIIWWYRNRKYLRHVYLIGWFNLLTVFVTLLEVADFPPILWMFDAHSLWHASTAPLTIFLYRFAISDCYYLNGLYKKNNV